METTSSRPRPPAATKRSAPDETSSAGASEEEEKEISAEENTETEPLREATTTTEEAENASLGKRRDSASNPFPAKPRSSVMSYFLKGEEGPITTSPAGARTSGSFTFKESSDRRPAVRS